MSLKAYRSKGGTLSIENYSIDHRAFPFSDENDLQITVKESRYETHPTRSVLPAAGATNHRMEFVVDPTTDGTMWDLNNSYVLFENVCAAIGANADDALSQFAANQMVSQCDVILGSTYVNDQQNLLYPQSAFVKDCLWKETPCTLSEAVTSVNDLTEDALLEGNYLSHPLVAMVAGANNHAGLFTRNYITGNIFYLKFKPKQTIFMTRKYIPSNNRLKLQLTVTLNNATQQGTAFNLTMLNATFYLKRIILHDDSLSAFNSALASSKLVYNLPFARVQSFDILAGASNVNVPNLFSTDNRPDLLVLFSVRSANDQTLPLTACGDGGYAAVGVTGNELLNAYVTYNGVQYPNQSSGEGYLANKSPTAYNEYVRNCLPPSERVYLDYLHWTNHYTLYCINLCEDQEKVWGKSPTESKNGMNLYTTFGGGNAATLYVVAFNNVHLTIDAGGQVEKIGF